MGLQMQEDNSLHFSMQSDDYDSNLVQEATSQASNQRPHTKYEEEKRDIAKTLLRLDSSQISDKFLISASNLARREGRISPVSADHVTIGKNLRGIFAIAMQRSLIYSLVLSVAAIWRPFSIAVSSAGSLAKATPILRVPLTSGFPNNLKSVLGNDIACVKFPKLTFDDSPSTSSATETDGCLNPIWQRS